MSATFAEPKRKEHTVDKILTIEEVAELTRAPLATLRWWKHVNRGPRAFKLGRRIVYKEADVRAWIDAQYGEQDRAV
jgi:predicted DNA-binding transcriptional regulator AlpA